MENNLIEKINIAELDPSKTYFLQMSCNHDMPVEQMQHVYRYLTNKFNEYGINNIIIYTPSDVTINFTEVANAKV